MVDGQELTVAFSPDLDRHETSWHHAGSSSQSPLKEPRHAARDAQFSTKRNIVYFRGSSGPARCSTRCSIRPRSESRLGSRLCDRLPSRDVSGVSQDVFVIFVILTRSSVYTQYPASSREKKLPIKVSRFDVDVSFSNLTERIALASFPTHSYTNAK
jgi:hypothetical protein